MCIIDDLILKELDKQKFNANVYNFIMNRLDNDEKKNKFLSYMISNENTIFNYITLINILNEIDKI